MQKAFGNRSVSEGFSFLLRLDAALIELLDQQVKVVRQAHRLAAELDGVRHILETVAGHDGDDRVVRVKNALLAKLLHARRAGHARRLTEHAAGRAEELLRRAPEYDYIITAEAKGIPLAHEMARLAGNQKYFIARKKAKAYMTGVFEVKVHSITTAGEQSLFLDKADADLIRGKKILLVDDVISTGGSLKAMEALVEKAGGTVTGRMAVLAEGGAADRKDILFLEKLPVFNADGSVK